MLGRSGKTDGSEGVPMIERRETFLVSGEELGPGGEWLPEKFQKRLVDLSVAHSQTLGCGWNAMRQAGAYWALSQWEARVIRHPTPGEPLSILTWPSPAQSAGIWRNYRVDSASGQPIAEAMALWAIVDIRTGKPRRCDTFPLWDSSLPYRFDRIWAKDRERSGEPIRSPESAVRRLIGNSDIDANGHVNNLRYLAYVQEALTALGDPWEKYDAYRIQYRSPLFAGELLILSLVRSEGRRELIGSVDRGGSPVTAFFCRIE